MTDMIKISPSNEKAAIKGGFSTEMVTALGVFFEAQKFCDVVLIASRDDSRISAHRVILCAASEYFMDHLKGSQANEFEIGDISGEILKLILNFIYTASIKITTDTVYEIMQAAVVLKLSTIERECSEFLSKSLDSSNCLPMAIKCTENNCMDLFDKSLMYAAQNFVELTDTEEYLRLDEELLAQILERDDLCVRTEDDVLCTILKWVEYDEPNRANKRANLIKYVRFPLLSQDFLLNKVTHLLPQPEFQGIIIKALKWHLAMGDNRDLLFSGEECKPRKHREQLMLITDGIELGMPIKALIFDPITCNWNSREWPLEPHPSWHTKGIVIDQKVYLASTVVVNGVDHSRIHSFDLNTQEWSILPQMIDQRFSFGMAELNGQLYVCGGHKNNENLCSVEKWDPKSPERWQKVSPMLHKRNPPGLVVFKGLMYAIGSTDDFEHNSFEFYDPETDTWAELCRPGTLRTSVTCCVAKGLLYAVGGRTESGICTIVERYDFEKNTWSEISPSQKFTEYVQCMNWMDRLMVLVETHQEDFKYAVEEYNPKTGQWRFISSFGKEHVSPFLVSNPI